MKRMPTQKTFPGLPVRENASAVGQVSPKSSEIHTLGPTPIATNCASAGSATAAFSGIGIPTIGWVIVFQSGPNVNDHVS